jgi:hypothetical protein
MSQPEVLAGAGGAQLGKVLFAVFYDYPLPSAIAFGGVLLLGVALWVLSKPHEPTRLRTKIGWWISGIVVLTIFGYAIISGFQAGNVWHPLHKLGEG